MIEINNMKFPLDRRYYKKHGNHIWLKEENGLFKVGMDSFITENAGFLSFITIDNQNLSQGDAIGSIESAKFVSKFYSPVSGKIVSINEDVVNDPIRVNRDPYNAWIVEIEPENLERDIQSEDIIEGEKSIKKWIESEIIRLGCDVSK